MAGYSRVGHHGPPRRRPRAAKSHVGETRAEQVARWTEQCGQSIGTGLAKVAHDVLARAQQAGEAARWSPRDILTRALAGVAETKQAWTRSALIRAVSDALPGNLRIAPAEVRPLLDGLADAALEHAVSVTEAGDTTNLPASELLANGQSPYSAPAVALFTTEGQMQAEHALAPHSSCAARRPLPLMRRRRCSTGSPRPAARWVSTRPLRSAEC